MHPELTHPETYFPPLHIDSESTAEKASMFIDKWTTDLHAIVDILEMNDTLFIHPDNVQSARAAIETWKTHPDHGAFHSFCVYEGMRTLDTAADDGASQALSVLHDFAQMLPLRHIQTGEEIPGDSRILHPETMAYLLLRLSPALNVERSIKRQLITAIRHHDDTYFTGSLHAHMPYIGQLLADSDKLFGAGILRTPHALAVDAMYRNFLGGSGETGWYLLRDDLSDSQRTSWKYGDRWYADMLSAVSTEMFDADFYTQKGQCIATEKRQAFMRSVEAFYRTIYTTQRSTVDSWSQAVACRDTTVSAFMVGRDQAPKPLHIQESHHIARTIDELYDTPLVLHRHPRRSDMIAKGWKIKLIGLEEQPVIIDPSIVRFHTQDSFADSLRTALHAFTQREVL